MAGGIHFAWPQDEHKFQSVTTQVREHGRLSNISGSSPTAGANLGAALPAQVGQPLKREIVTTIILPGALLPHPQPQQHTFAGPCPALGEQLRKL